MKLVVVARKFWSDSGQANATREVTRELVKLGVELVAIIHSDNHVSNMKEPMAQLSPVYIGVKQNLLARSPFASYRVSKRAAKIIGSLRKDLISDCLIHSHSLYPSAFFGRSKSSPRFFLNTIHGTFEGEINRFKREMPVHPRELLYRASYTSLLYLNRYFVRHSRAHFIALSPRNATEIVRAGGQDSRVHLISNGVDPYFFKPYNRDEARKQLGLPTDKQIVLTINKIEARKGLHTLIRAAHKIVKEVPETYFVVVGSIPKNRLWYMSYLRRLLTKFNLKGCFRITGFVPKAQLPLYINSGDIFTLNSYAEGAPLVIPEAMACGRLVVATEDAAAGYLPTNLIARDGDHEDLAHRISYYLLNERERRRSAEDLRQKALKEFTWRRIAEKTLALYRSIIARNPV